jgi:hypothetical protein
MSLTAVVRVGWKSTPLPVWSGTLDPALLWLSTCAHVENWLLIVDDRRASQANGGRFDGRDGDVAERRSQVRWRCSLCLQDGVVSGSQG